jgi:hypothetical protein
LGHIHLAELPRSKKWKIVYDLIVEDAPTRMVIAASIAAATRDLETAAKDSALAEGVRLLATVPEQAQSADFGAHLRAVGIDVPDEPRSEDLAAGLSRALERMRSNPDVGSDLAEIVRRTLLSTLVARLTNLLPDLLTTDSENLRRALAQLGGGSGFSLSARAFFARLSANILGYWLDRTLSAQLGPDRRFATLADRDDFDAALDRACIEAAEIVDELAEAWFEAALIREGRITSARASAFAELAFQKVLDELRQEDA